MKTNVIIGIILFFGALSMVWLQWISMTRIITGIILSAPIVGFLYFITTSQFAENARMGSLLRKHGKDVYETLGGHLVIKDCQITDNRKTW